MVNARIYVEGGGQSKEGKARCREGFRKLLEKCGLTGRMPRLVACGGRDTAFDSFSTAHSKANAAEYVALLVDSEDPVSNIDETWKHLEGRDGWKSPHGAHDDQVLLMTTCMETWVVADRDALKKHFGQGIQLDVLPSLVNLESRSREDVQTRLENATRSSPGPYAKGPKSYEVLSKVDPDMLESNLPSFKRARKILDEKLS